MKRKPTVDWAEVYHSMYGRGVNINVDLVWLDRALYASTKKGYYHVDHSRSR